MPEIEQQIETQPVDQVQEPVNESISLREEIEQASKAVRERDEVGRFKAKAAETTEPAAEKPAEPAKAATEAPKVETPKAEQTEQPEMPKSERPSLAPNSWSSTAKAKWADLPSDIQAEISKREADVHKEFTRQDGERQFGKSLKQVIDPYMPLIAQEGGNPVAAVQSLLETARVLRTADPTTKANLVRNLCQQYGVDVGTLAGEQQYVDPTVQHLQTQLQQLQYERQQQQYLAQQQQQSELQNAIGAFAADPKNVHFEHVKGHMAALLQAGQAKDLQDAYDQAVWARPDIRSNLLAEQQRAAEEKRLADMKAKADAAKRAAGSVTGSPGIGQSTDPKAGQRTLRDELAAAMAAHRV